MKKFLIVSCVAALALPTVAFADVSAELTVASNHAGMASKAPALDTVHMHLHHVVNCLVGPMGTGFDATNANPCAKQGNGAIADSTDAAQKTKLAAAVTKINAGLASTDLAAAQKDASDASAAIDGAK